MFVPTAAASSFLIKFDHKLLTCYTTVRDVDIRYIALPIVCCQKKDALLASSRFVNVTLKVSEPQHTVSFDTSSTNPMLAPWEAEDVASIRISVQQRFDLTDRKLWRAPHIFLRLHFIAHFATILETSVRVNGEEIQDLRTKIFIVQQYEATDRKAAEPLVAGRKLLLASATVTTTVVNNPPIASRDISIKSSLLLCQLVFMINGWRWCIMHEQLMKLLLQRTGHPVA